MIQVSMTASPRASHLLITSSFGRAPDNRQQRVQPSETLGRVPIFIIKFFVTPSHGSRTSCGRLAVTAVQSSLTPKPNEKNQDVSHHTDDLTSGYGEKPVGIAACQKCPYFR